MARELGICLSKRGYRNLVFAAGSEEYRFEGGHVYGMFGRGNNVVAFARQSDLIISQLGLVPLAVHIARGLNLPLIQIVHSTLTESGYLVSENRAGSYVVYNSNWVQDELRLPQPGIVVRPPVDWRAYRVETNRRYITLINVRERKGGSLLVELARRMPDKRFLGVLGFTPDMVRVDGLENLTYLPNDPDIKKIFSQTDVLIIPSDYESWGRVGIEACSSGIPVIAHPTPGLRESLSHAGLFCDRSRPEDWVRMIRRLESPEFYRTVSVRCFQRAQELDPAQDLERFGDFVDSVVGIESKS